MSKVAFGQKPGGPETLVPVADLPAGLRTASVENPEGAAVTPGTAPALAVAPVAPVQPPAKSSFNNDDEEPFETSDMVIPRFSVVQKVGELSNIFPGGSLVLNSTLVLADAGKEFKPSEPIRIVVLGIQPTTFSEKLEGGVRGKYFKSEAEVAADGGTLDWNEHKATKKSLYQRVSTALLLIEKPEKCPIEEFPVTVEGKQYALALYTMKGTSYTNAARHFKTAKKMGHLKQHGYRGGYWTFQSLLKKFDSNFAFIPVVKSAGPTTEAFREEVKALLGF